MKILLDTNVFISYLLAKGTRNKVMEAVEACLTDPEVEIVVPQEVIDEIKRVVADKEYLRSRITEESLADFLKAIATLGEIRPPLTDIASISRDRDDDFLLAHSIGEGVEYLVTGDDDLLSLGGVGSVEIMTISRLSDMLLYEKHEKK